MTRVPRLWVTLFALALLTACGSSDSGETSTSTSAAPPVSAPVAAPATPQGPRTKNWFDLQAGDCVTEIPAIDTGVVTTSVVDCTAPHRAEVYLLAPLAVDTAIGQVANEKCITGFVDYTGRSVNDSPLLVTYLIDSNQDRTSDNPTPSTAICLLQAKNGEPLTDSARR